MAFWGTLRFNWFFYFLQAIFYQLETQWLQVFSYFVL